MTEQRSSERKQSERPARRTKRLSAALRENLKRRKAQARGRAASSQQQDNVSAPAGNADEDKTSR